VNALRVIDELRVLARDHEMEAQRPEAVQWVEDRVESSWALASGAVKLRSNARETLASVERSVQRSFFAASSEKAYPQPFERWTMPIERRRLGLPDAPSREQPEVRWSMDVWIGHPTVARDLNASTRRSAWRSRAARGEQAVDSAQRRCGELEQRAQQSEAASCAMTSGEPTSPRSQ
jgi:hypothetical protein